MKKIYAFSISILMTTASFAQCQPIGWILVGQRQISITETQCIWEKNGARVSLIVSGFCPMSPC
jgi:hypothetical protein